MCSLQSRVLLGALLLLVIQKSRRPINDRCIIEIGIATLHLVWLLRTEESASALERLERVSMSLTKAFSGKQRDRTSAKHCPACLTDNACLKSQSDTMLSDHKLLCMRDLYGMARRCSILTYPNKPQH
jgi:hypothetical protein